MFHVKHQFDFISQKGGLPMDRDARRDALVAVLALAALAGAALFLLLGSLPPGHIFTGPAARPGHTAVQEPYRQAMIRAQEAAFKADHIALPALGYCTDQGVYLPDGTVLPPEGAAVLSDGTVYLTMEWEPLTDALPDGTPMIQAPAPVLRSDRRLGQREEDLRHVRTDHPPILAAPLERSAPSAGEVLEAVSLRAKDLRDSAEAKTNEILDRDHGFIEVYGAAQRLLGRRVLEDQVEPQYTVVKLTDGFLTFANLDAEQTDLTVRAREMTDFAKRVDRQFHVPVLYVQAPSKFNVADAPDGVEDFSDAEADQFLSDLAEQGEVDTLDLRPAFRQAAEDDPEEALGLFFGTDHHWTPAGAFLGYQVLCEKLKEDYEFDIPRSYTDPRSYTTYSFEQVFLGSQGKRVGAAYAGVDGIDVWVPTFDTDFSYVTSGGVRKGPFQVSLLFPEKLAQTGLYDTNPYVIYSGGDYLLSQAINHKNTDGKRVMILRDSFGCALTPFLSLVTAQTDAIDPRSFDGGQKEMLDYVEWLEPDLIIVLNAPSSLKTDALYPYLPSARAAALDAQEETQAQAQAKKEAEQQLQALLPW